MRKWAGCDYGAGAGKKGDWHCRFGMSDALMWANTMVGAVRELGQLGFFRTQKGTEEEYRQDIEGALDTGRAGH